MSEMLTPVESWLAGLQVGDPAEAAVQWWAQATPRTSP